MTDGDGVELRDGDLISAPFVSSGRRHFGIFDVQKTLDNSPDRTKIYAIWEAEEPGTWSSSGGYMKRSDVRFETRLPKSK